MNLVHEVRGIEDVEHLSKRWGSAEPPKDGDSEAAAPKIEAVADVGRLSSYAAQKMDFVVHNVLIAGTVTALTGDSGSGKSTFITSLTSAVERGVEFAGFPTQRRPVAIFDRENPLSIVWERFNRLKIADSENFVYWGGWAAEEAPAPGSPIVLDWVKSCEPKPVAVFDSFAAFNGGDENSASETRKYMQAFRRLADMGATVIVLHHTGKSDSAKDYRGSSDIKASIDVGYHLANLGDVSRLGTLRLRAFKSRFSVEPEIILQYTDNGFVRDNRGPSLSVTESLQALLIRHPHIPASEFENLAVDKGIGRSRARQFLTAGVAGGSIKSAKGRHNTRHHTWTGSTDTEEPLWSGE